MVRFLHAIGTPQQKVKVLLFQIILRMSGSKDRYTSGAELFKVMTRCRAVVFPNLP